MAQYLGALDQGTTSTRFMVFDRSGKAIASAQKEHEQIYPAPGWVEHRPLEIWERTQQVIAEVCNTTGFNTSDIACIGMTNQRETTVVWDRITGEPVTNALVWQDTRVGDYVARFAAEGGQDRFRAKTGLPLATYFSGLKIRWILDNIGGVRARAERGELYFGNIDSYLLWNLTGGTQGGVHKTDVTNASRTQLMNLDTLQWDDEMLRLFDIPRSLMPQICSSSCEFGRISTTRSLARPASNLVSSKTPTAPAASC
jgi:glycerol kinase